MSNFRVIYLHGFASSPQSRKAQFFVEKLKSEGFTVEVPDLAADDFEHLTLSGQLKIVEKLLAAGPAVVFGSSLGGYLAAIAAARYPEKVEKVVLLAPAFGFYNLWQKELGEEKLAAWRKNGSMGVFHYGQGKEVPLAFDLMEDAAQFEAFPEFGQPGLLFHGVHDPLVPVAQSRRFAASHGNIHFLEFESGHELTDVLDDMWRAARDFVVGGDL